MDDGLAMYDALRLALVPPSGPCSAKQRRGRSPSAVQAPPREQEGGLHALRSGLLT